MVQVVVVVIQTVLELSVELYHRLLDRVTVVETVLLVLTELQVVVVVRCLWVLMQRLELVVVVVMVNIYQHKLVVIMVIMVISLAAVAVVDLLLQVKVGREVVVMEI